MLYLASAYNCFHQNQNTDYNVIVDASSTILQNINHMTNITSISQVTFFFVSEHKHYNDESGRNLLQKSGLGSVLY